MPSSYQEEYEWVEYAKRKAIKKGMQRSAKLNLKILLPGWMLQYLLRNKVKVAIHTHPPWGDGGRRF